MIPFLFVDLANLIMDRAVAVWVVSFSLSGAINSHSFYLLQHLSFKIIEEGCLGMYYIYKCPYTFQFGNLQFCYFLISFHTCNTA